MTPPPPPSIRTALSGRVAGAVRAVLALALLWIYGFGVATYPLKWEEPRRALVAIEMIARGDYIVPHLLGEPYRNKPPLHNWLIVLAAGNDAARIVPLTVRLPSLLATLGTAVLLFVLGRGRGGSSPPFATLLFLTAATTIQFGRAGETDMLFTFLLAAAFAAYELGRRRRSPSLQWIVSQAMVGLAVLAKGIAPLYFYPPLLFLSLRRREEFPFSRRAFALGAGVLAILVAAWIVPFALESSLPALTRQAGSELAERTPLRETAPGANRQPPYPIMLILMAAPWSPLLLALLVPRVRRLTRDALAEPYVVLAIAILAWGALLFAVVPRARPRYLLPVLPFAAVMAAAVLSALSTPAAANTAAPSAANAARRPLLARNTAWCFLAGLFYLFVVVAGRTVLAATPSGPRLALAVAAAAAGTLVIVAGAWASRRADPLAVWLLALGLLYGVCYTGFWERRDADRRMRAVRAAQMLAAAAPPDATPVVCRNDFDRQVAYALAHARGRPLTVEVPAGAYVFVARETDPAPAGAERVAFGHGVAAYRVPAAPSAVAPSAVGLSPAGLSPAAPVGP
jgi:4-amino-4-deoxy-L-arabinose transferase-like glycosyltransferase